MLFYIIVALFVTVNAGGGWNQGYQGYQGQHGYDDQGYHEYDDQGRHGYGDQGRHGYDGHVGHGRPPPSCPPVGPHTCPTGRELKKCTIKTSNGNTRSTCETYGGRKCIAECPQGGVSLKTSITS